MMYISQWLKLGRGKLHSHSGMQTFSKPVGQREWVDGTFTDW
jgi:hypothetical protein